MICSALHFVVHRLGVSVILLFSPMELQIFSASMKITSHISRRIHVIQIFDPYANALSFGRLIIVLIISNSSHSISSPLRFVYIRKIDHSS